MAAVLLTNISANWFVGPSVSVNVLRAPNPDVKRAITPVSAAGHSNLAARWSAEWRNAGRARYLSFVSLVRAETRCAFVNLQSRERGCATYMESQHTKTHSVAGYQLLCCTASHWNKQYQVFVLRQRSVFMPPNSSEKYMNLSLWCLAKQLAPYYSWAGIS